MAGARRRAPHLGQIKSLLDIPDLPIKRWYLLSSVFVRLRKIIARRFGGEQGPEMYLRPCLCPLPVLDYCPFLIFLPLAVEYVGGSYWRNSEFSSHRPDHFTPGSDLGLDDSVG